MSQEWWLVPVISALGKLRQKNGCKFKASLNYNVKSCPQREVGGGNN